MGKRILTRTLVLLIGLLVGTLEVRAQAERGPIGVKKPAWKWTLDERLGKRLNPEEIKRRADARVAEEAEARKIFGNLPAVKDQDAGSSRTDLIDGKKTPELFLTSELFDALLRDAFPIEGESSPITRRQLEEKAAALGLGRDFWRRLREISAPYLRLQNEHRRLAMAQHKSAGSQDSEMRGLSTSMCKARADAIAAAKAQFGEEPFLRLLYEGLAPNLAIGYVPEQELADQLRAMEEGCR